MITGVFLTNYRGDVLYQRLSREDEVTVPLAETFRLAVVLPGDRNPVTLYRHISFCHIKIGDVFVAAATCHNADVLVIFEFLRKFSNILHNYFNGKFNEKHITANVPLIHEVIDEILDYGYPQATDLETVQGFITQAKLDPGQVTSYLAFGSSKKAGMSSEQMTELATGTTPWRHQGITYKKNELWIDVVENINLLVSPQGTVLKSEVEGTIQIKCQLGGMPHCEFGINDKLMIDKEKASGKTIKPGSSINLDDLNFHQCVRLPLFEQQRIVSFVPPDGVFTLLKYRSTQRVALPFRISSHLKQISPTKIEYEVTVISEFQDPCHGQKVRIKIPTPESTAICKTHVKGLGSAKHHPEESAIIWKIKKFPAHSEVTLRASVELIATSAGKAWDHPPISMQFSVPGFAASGVRIRYLKIEETTLGYRPSKWVRYVTKAGTYERRIS